MSDSDTLLVNAFNDGRLLAYPTEAVFGLGCDPLNEKAVKLLLKLKDRPWQKGLILVASHVNQITPYVDMSLLSFKRIEQIEASWPGPVTWLLPKTKQVPDWISGESDFVAVRVSAHPDVIHLCELFNSPLVSTSANKSGQPPIKVARDIASAFDESYVVIVPGKVGDQVNPSEIRHSISGEIIRAS